MFSENIGIFGGTFDPVHNGHLKIAALVQKKFQLNKIIFVPAGTPPHKKKPAAGRKHRLTMVRLAIKNRKNFDLSDFESRKSGPSFSLDTLKYFKKKFPRSVIYFIIGLDSWLELDSWYRPAEILKICHLVVIYRPPAAEIGRNNGGRIHFLKNRPIQISSSDIRRRMRLNKSVENLLPLEILKYIRQNKLYQ